MGIGSDDRVKVWLNGEVVHVNNVHQGTTERGRCAHTSHGDTNAKKTHPLSNYPNPFNPETWIPYQLAKPANVTLTIYAADGRLIRTLALGHQAAGLYQSRSRAAYWNGKNELGEKVASGMYFYTLTTGEFTATRKMLIQK